MEKKEIIVIAPKGCESYLTEGKEYKATKHGRLCYKIKVDKGVAFNRDAYILLKQCPHLNGGDWIIKKENNYTILKSLFGVLGTLFCVYAMLKVPIVTVIFGFSWLCFISYMYFNQIFKK